MAVHWRAVQRPTKLTTGNKFLLCGGPGGKQSSPSAHRYRICSDSCAHRVLEPDPEDCAAIAASIPASRRGRGTPLAAQGTATVEVVLGNQRFSVPVTVVDDITTDIILGVRNWPTPPNKLAVQQFLGLASYYRRFVPDFASIAQPLHRLTEKIVPFVWNEGCQQAFKELKERLTTTLILAFPDFSCTFLLDTDASDHGTGAVLSQVAADVLSKLEHNYCVTRHATAFSCRCLCRAFPTVPFGMTVLTTHGSSIHLVAPKFQGASGTAG